MLGNRSHLDSPVHRLPASLKLAGALGVVLLITLTPQHRPWLLAVVGAGLLAVAALARMPAWFLLRRMILLEPLVLGAAMLALFGPGGWRTFLFLVARSTLGLLTLVLLANTTPFERTLATLRCWRMPSLMVTTLALTDRYLHVLVEESQRLRRARAGRTFVAGRRSAWRSLGSVAGHLFLRSLDRAERIYAAMCARGWQ